MCIAMARLPDLPPKAPGWRPRRGCLLDPAAARSRMCSLLRVSVSRRVVPLPPHSPSCLCCGVVVQMAAALFARSASRPATGLRRLSTTRSARAMVAVRDALNMAIAEEMERDQASQKKEKKGKKEK